MSKKDFPELTKTMHESQEKWRDKNWKETLEKHKKEIEGLLDKIDIFDVWSNSLQDSEVAKRLIPEIFMDAYISIHFAGYGLYKYAYMSLRSELETALRLLFFSTHPVEFKWWFDGDEWYSTTLEYPFVWGKRYHYFQHLDNIKRFEEKCGYDGKNLFEKTDCGIKGLYRELSKSIHSGRGHFQTRPDGVSPTYDYEQFEMWHYICENVQMYIHIILALGFAEEFKSMSSTHRNKILNVGMGNYYKEKVKEVLDL